MHSYHFQLRPLTASDIPACIDLFYNTVHQVNKKDYNSIQLKAWAPENIGESAQWQTLLKNFSYVVTYDEVIIGFADLSPTGYLDRLFVHKDWQRHGVATLLLLQLELIAKQNQLKKIITEASITAKPFFEKMGYRIVEQQDKLIRGEMLINFKMEKNFY